MSRKRTAAATGVEPPNLPAELAPLAPPIALSDEDSYSAVVIADAELSASRVTDLSFDQVLCRRVRFAQAELERPQLTDVQLDNVAWDGGVHAFLLDTTVHPDVQRRGLGTQLVQAAAAECFARGLHWLHVDYEPHLDDFYRGCGFVHTHAGLLRLNGSAEEAP